MHRSALIFCLVTGMHHVTSAARSLLIYGLISTSCCSGDLSKSALHDDAQID